MRCTAVVVVQHWLATPRWVAPELASFLMQSLLHLLVASNHLNPHPRHLGSCLHCIPSLLFVLTYNKGAREAL